MLTAINDYRNYHGKHSISVDGIQNDYCKEHCWAMVRADTLYHAAPHHLNEWGEIIAMCSQYQDWGQVERSLIAMIDNSEPHRNILLNASIIGYCVVAFRWKVFLTIRAK